jgi:hypothetical protein
MTVDRLLKREGMVRDDSPLRLFQSQMFESTRKTIPLATDAFRNRSTSRSIGKLSSIGVQGEEIAPLRCGPASSQLFFENEPRQ